MINKKWGVVRLLVNSREHCVNSEASRKKSNSTWRTGKATWKRGDCLLKNKVPQQFCYLKCSWMGAQ